MSHPMWPLWLPACTKYEFWNKVGWPNYLDLFQPIVTYRVNLASVTHALVKSRLDCCNSLYMELPLERIWKLPLLQNAAARMLRGNSKFYESCTDSPLISVPSSKVLVLTFNTLHGLGLGYLKGHLFCFQPSCALHSAGEALLVKPLAKEGM